MQLKKSLGRVRIQAQKNKNFLLILFVFLSLFYPLEKGYASNTYKNRELLDYERFLQDIHSKFNDQAFLYCVKHTGFVKNGVVHINASYLCASVYRKSKFIGYKNYKVTLDKRTLVLQDITEKPQTSLWGFLFAIPAWFFEEEPVNERSTYTVKEIMPLKTVLGHVKRKEYAFGAMLAFDRWNITVYEDINIKQFKNARPIEKIQMRNTR